MQLSNPWKKRLTAHLRGTADKKEVACPELAKVSGDEFQRREQTAKAEATCHDTNEKAKAFVKTCPISDMVRLDLQEYDFDRHIFPMRSHVAREIESPREGRVVVSNFMSFGLSWPGAAPKPFTPPPGVDVCNTAIGSTMKLLTEFAPSIAISEGDAPALKKKITDALASESATSVWLEIALLADGAAANEPLPCNMVYENMPKGRALAWRMFINTHPMTMIANWTTITPWEPPASCKEAAEFFGKAQNEDEFFGRAGKKGRVKDQ